MAKATYDSPTESVLCAIITMDATGRISAWNAHAERLFGWTRAEALGRSLDTVLFPDHSQDGGRGLWPSLGPEASPERRIELIAKRRDGSPVPIAMTVAEIGFGEARILVAFAQDISEMRRAEGVLRQSEAQYRLLFERNPRPMWVFDFETLRFLAVNEAAIRHYGYSRQEFLAMSIQDIRPTADAPAVLDIINQFRGREFSLQMAGHWRHVKKDGTMIEVEIYWNSIDFAGRPAALVMARDITARKRSAQMLRRRTRFLRLLQDVAFAANQAKTSTDAIQVCLARVCASIHCPVGHAYLPSTAVPNTLVSSSIWHLDPPEQFEVFRRTTGPLEFPGGVGLPGRVLASGRPAWVEDVRTDPNFLRADVARQLGIQTAFAFPILVGSQVAGVLEFFMTERRLPDEELLAVSAHLGEQVGHVLERERAEHELRGREERLRLMTERMPAVLWSVDSDLRFTSSTGAGLEPLAIPPEGVIGMTLMEYFRTTDRTYTPIAMHLRALQGESVSYEFEWNGRTFQTHVVPMRDAQGHTVGCIGAGLDVTERIRAEERLRISREQFRQLARRLQSIRDEEQARIAREVHDEFGQRLTALRMDLAWLQGRLDGSAPEVSERMEHMLQGVDDTIDSVREIVAQLRPPMLEDLGLESAIEWMTQRFSAQSGIACEYEGRLGEHSVDPERSVAAFRILQEALTNAARHAGASRVRVSARVEEGRLLLEVRDDGQGITEDETTNPRSFGLIGMRERALAWGGEVTVTGMPGQGTRVRLQLPLADPAPEQVRP